MVLCIVKHAEFDILGGPAWCVVQTKICSQLVKLSLSKIVRASCAFWFTRGSSGAFQPAFEQSACLSVLYKAVTCSSNFLEQSTRLSTPFTHSACPSGGALS